MNTDYSYCSGVTCSIRKSCKRYLPDPPDTHVRIEIGDNTENPSYCFGYIRFYRYVAISFN